MLAGMKLQELLEQVARGSLSVSDALEALDKTSLANLDFARVDTGRARRRGLPEVILCPGKTPEQVSAIISTLHAAGQSVLATRATPELYAALRDEHPGLVYHPVARALTLDHGPLPQPRGLVAVLTGGTADLPVAEEACLAAERMGARIERMYDVGVAGLHRLLAGVDLLQRARVIVAVAGMEGALPSVAAGLTRRPLIAVPTSSGPGLHLGGAVPLLAMLNACVSGVTVVNVDNGFGAGVAAAMINRLPEDA